MNIIILHGLYMHGIVMKPLASKLETLGHQTKIISYNTLSIDDDALFEDIDQALSSSQPNVLIGHSLGGVNIKRYLASRKPAVDIISHVVILASPINGASIVNQIEKLGLSKILGNADARLKPHDEKWEHPQRLLSIAGDLPIGLRPLLMQDNVISDGTVAVEETKIEGMHSHHIIHRSHTSIIYSEKTVHMIQQFINE